MSIVQIRNIETQIQALTKKINDIVPAADDANNSTEYVSKETFNELYQHQLSLQNTVNGLKGEVALATAELVTLKTQLSEFYAQYDAKLQAQFQKWKEEILAEVTKE